MILCVSCYYQNKNIFERVHKYKPVFSLVINDYLLLTNKEQIVKRDLLAKCITVYGIPLVSLSFIVFLLCVTGFVGTPLL